MRKNFSTDLQMLEAMRLIFSIHRRPLGLQNVMPVTVCSAKAQILRIILGPVPRFESPCLLVSGFPMKRTLVNVIPLRGLRINLFN